VGEAKAEKMTFTKWHSLLNLALYTLVGLLFYSNALAGITYTNDEFGFTIEFPENWEVKEGAAASTIIKAVHKDASGLVLQITIAVYPGNYKRDIWSYTGAQMLEIFKMTVGTDAALLDWGKTTFSGEHALWAMIEARSPILPYLTWNNNVIRGPRLFMINALAAGSAAPSFAQHEAEIDRAIRSFRFLGR